MATYVVSDVHGYYNRLMDVLKQANFDKTKDTLYVLGDLCDRGPHNGEMLDWAYDQPNSVKFSLGNHEDMMLATIKDYEHFIKSNVVRSREEESYYRYDFVYNNIWTVYNGGLKTFEYLMNLPRVRRNDILNWISKWPLYYDIEVNGRRFLLVHAGFAMSGIRMSDDFYQKGTICWEEIDGIEKPQLSQTMLWIRENWILNREDLPCDVIFGHTSSVEVYNMITDFNKWAIINGDEPIPIEKGKEIVHFGKGLKKHCIDSGRQVLSLLCLDTMEEFVSDIEEGNIGD